MIRRLIVFALAGSCLSVPTWSAPVVAGCGARPAELVRQLTPLTPGPARLSSITCGSVRDNGLTRTSPEVSPDGRRFFVHQYRDGLTLESVAADEPPTRFALDPTFLTFAHGGHPALAWSGDSKSVWAVTQDVERPSHFATGPLRAVRAWAGGRLERLPALPGSAGDLDGVLWAGGEGLALAQFGSRGGAYRPERDNPRPTLAVIDARRGMVLQTIAMDGVPELTFTGADGTRNVAISIAVATVARGRVHAILGLQRRWVTWVQGEAPRSLALPYDTWGLSVALTAKGERILIMPPLTANGPICEHNPHCPAPSAVTGLLAALHDTRTGKAIWRIEATARQFESYPKPAISPDGRFALVGLPSEVGGSPRAALLDLRDGGVLQTFHDPSHLDYAVGFTDGGRRAWISAGPIVALYDLTPRPRNKGSGGRGAGHSPRSGMRKSAKRFSARIPL